MLITSECFKKNVTTKTGTLGLFVNLVFDKESHEARMVVFPNLQDFKKKAGALSTLSSMGASALSSVSYNISEQLGGTATGVLTDAAYRASAKADQKKYDKIQEIASTYYLLPVSEISEMKEDRITVDKPLEEYSLYLGMKGTETDLAFFNDELYKEPDRYVGISVGLVSIRGQSLKDPDGTKGRIVDVVFDTNAGVITHFVVTTIEKGAQPRYVEVNSVDLSGMTVKRTLKEYPTSI